MMKKTNSFVFGLIVLTVASFTLLGAAAGFAACPDDIVNYWKLDEAAAPFADFIGDADGASDPADPGPVAGIVDGAQDFSGAVGIAVPPSKSFNWLNGDSFTMEYWINIDPGDLGASLQEVLARTGAGVYWYTGITGTDGFATLELVDSDAVSSTLTGTTGLADGSWHHIAVVRDASTDLNYLYVDGDLEDFSPGAVGYTGGFSSIDADLTIGYLSGNGTDFEGSVDEVALFDRALDQDEIQDHYDVGLDGDSITTLRPVDNDDGGSSSGGGGGGGGCFISSLF